jgi:hypothetical protein
MVANIMPWHSICLVSGIAALIDEYGLFGSEGKKWLESRGEL